MSKQFAEAVGHIPSGLFVVTSYDGSQIDGYLASWVQQISFDPLMVTVSIKEGRPGYEHIMSGKIFAINIVAKDNMDYLKHFWKGYEKSPFEEIAHEVTREGAVILKDAKSAIVCEMDSRMSPGDHELVFAKVLNSYVLDQNSKVKVHIRKSGLDY